MSSSSSSSKQVMALLNLRRGVLPVVPRLPEVVAVLPNKKHTAAAHYPRQLFGSKTTWIPSPTKITTTTTTTTTSTNPISQESIIRTFPPLHSSSIGSDVEMIAANHRIATTATDIFMSPTQLKRSYSMSSLSSSPLLSSSSLSSTSVSSSLPLSSSHLPSSLISNIYQPNTNTSNRYYSTTTTNTQQAATSTATELSSDNNTSTNNGDEMKDEYGTMDSSGKTYQYAGEFVLENGQVLPTAELRYQTYGTLNETTRDNVLVVCHALTGNASLHSWWGNLLGPGRAFDTDQYYIVCCNILGSCYGSTNPTSINPNTGERYGIDFPDISVQDTVRLQLALLKEELYIDSVKCVIGGSFGGMQAMEYAVQGGSTLAALNDVPKVQSVIPIACGAYHTAWQIGISEVQRQAIYKDPAWRAGNYWNATNGLEIARQLGMISYRTPLGYSTKFGRNQQQTTAVWSNELYGSKSKWDVQTYLQYQGTKFLTRFDPVTYVKLTEQMDSHNIARGRANTVSEVLQAITIPTCVVGIDSDILYPLSEQEYIANTVPNGSLQIIHSIDGHDGFLLEQEQVSIYIKEFLASLT